MCYNDTRQEVKTLKKEIEFTAKQVGERVKERRTELNLTMPELGKRIGVNKSTIQRYEADGVDPKRTMIINGLADALLTTPEWLTGLSEEKEYDADVPYRLLKDGRLDDSCGAGSDSCNKQTPLHQGVDFFCRF